MGRHSGRQLDVDGQVQVQAIAREMRRDGALDVIQIALEPHLGRMGLRLPTFQEGPDGNAEDGLGASPELLHAAMMPESGDTDRHLGACRLALIEKTRCRSYGVLPCRKRFTTASTTRSWAASVNRPAARRSKLW